MHKISENFLPGYGAQSTNLGAESGPADTIETAAYINMKYYHNIVVYGIASNVASDAVLTLTIWEATASGGTNSQTTTKTDVFTSTNVTDTDILQAEIKADELSNGFTHVGAKLVSDDGSCTGIVALMLQASSPRYARNSLIANS